MVRLIFNDNNKEITVPDCCLDTAKIGDRIDIVDGVDSITYEVIDISFEVRRWSVIKVLYLVSLGT